MAQRIEVENLVPEMNIQAARFLYVLEVSLRELIIEVLTERTGAHWYDKCLPKDVKDKYLSGLKSERAATWTEHTEHHPLYYVDFPDLVKVLSKNWGGVFEEVFPNKEVLMADLKKVEPIRNKIAHNRLVSEFDHNILSGVLASVQSYLGNGRLETLIDSHARLPNRADLLSGIKGEISKLTECMLQIKEPVPAPSWENSRAAWWFSSEYLTGKNIQSKLERSRSSVEAIADALKREKKVLNGLTKKFELGKLVDREPDALGPIKKFFDAWTQYLEQPRTRGTGHILEAWRDTQQIEALAEEARVSLRNLEGIGESNDESS